MLAWIYSVAITSRTTHLHTRVVPAKAAPERERTLLAIMGAV